MVSHMPQRSRSYPLGGWGRGWGGVGGGGGRLTVVGLNLLSAHAAGETGIVSLLRVCGAIGERLLPPLVICQKVEFTQQQLKGQRLAGALRSDAGGASAKSRCLEIAGARRLTATRLVCLPHQLLLFTPSRTPLVRPSLHPQRGEGKSGGFLALPGATGSLCHPLTQTAGSALHTRIIRR